MLYHHHSLVVISESFNHHHPTHAAARPVSMEPSPKRRKLAAKGFPTPTPQGQSIQDINSSSPQAYSTTTIANTATTNTNTSNNNNNNQDFEAFARHLQDAAVYIQREYEPNQYSNVHVLLLSWQDGDSVTKEESADLESVFRHDYGFHTQTWQIPSTPNPSVKLGARIVSLLEAADPDSLLIIHYAGLGYHGQDGHLYWASNSKDDAPKLKWDGIRCLLEDAQPDILLFLDSCFPSNTGTSGSHGSKQVIGSYSLFGASGSERNNSITSYLTRSLRRLKSTSKFTANTLFTELSASMPERRGSNDTRPVLATLTPDKKHDIILSPRPSARPGATNTSGSRKGSLTSSIDSVQHLFFKESRVLVCTTFVGDSSSSMTHLHQWKSRPPFSGGKIDVEGMFLGPPTTLLLSMPTSMWEVIQHDKVCWYLGPIKSRNIVHLYDNLTEDNDKKLIKSDYGPSTSSPMSQKAMHNGIAADSVEIQRAAEQLKALSHIRQENTLPAIAPAARGTLASILSPIDTVEATEASDASKAYNTNIHTRSDVTLPPLNFSPSSSQSNLHHSQKARQQLKKDVSCTHCSHAPFRDASSLRKHIAAAHTRPFPCAFAFAGCMATFGSKNEWKRHIGSQHLCLQFYRCSACPPSAATDGKGNEFNRKDLFTQHLRRMHAPLDIKRSSTPEVQEEWEARVRDMQDSCLVTRRQPPQKSACPKQGCNIDFEGRKAWDEWTEHVGRHMEKGQGEGLGIDQLLVDWAINEGIVERDSPGSEAYRFCISGNERVDVDKEVCRQTDMEKKDSQKIIEGQVVKTPGP